MKKAWKVSAALLSVAALAACSGQKGDDAQQAEQPSKSKISDAWKQKNDVLTFYYMYADDNERTWQEQEAALITKKFPNITFTFMRNHGETKIADAIAGGARIDFFGGTAQDIITLQDLRMLGDITDLVEADKLNMGIYADSAMNAMKSLAGGKLVGFPVTINSFSIFYNKDIFDKFGVPYLKDDSTWDDIISSARRMTRMDGGVQYYGFGTHIDLLSANNGPIPYVNASTNKATLNTDYFKKMLDRVLPLTQLAPTSAENDAMWNYPHSQFGKERNIAILVANSSAWGFNKNLNGAEPINFDFIGLPSFKDMPNSGPPANPYYYFMSSTTPNREAVYEVLKYRASEEVLLHFARQGKIVALKDKAWTKEFGVEEPTLKGLNVGGIIPKTYGEVVVNHRYAPTAKNHLNSKFREVIKGNTDVNSALRDAEEAANKAIEDLERQRK